MHPTINPPGLDYRPRAGESASRGATAFTVLVLAVVVFLVILYLTGDGGVETVSTTTLPSSGTTVPTSSAIPTPQP